MISSTRYQPASAVHRRARSLRELVDIDDALVVVSAVAELRCVHPKGNAGAHLRRSFRISKVGLEPTRVLARRILSPARLPSAWHWADVGLTLISGSFQGPTMAPVVVRIVVALG